MELHGVGWFFFSGGEKEFPEKDGRDASCVLPSADDVILND